MSFIFTFLGKGGSGRTTMAIAAAKKLANSGVRVLLAGQDPSPTLGLLLGAFVSTSPTEIAPNLSVVQLSSTTLLEQAWEQVKELESKYLRSPILKNVYGQELGILPGMDSALALNAIREYENSDRYDVIIYDGLGDINTLRMLGIPEILSWYVRRFRQVFADSDLGKAISPFVQPITAAVLNVSWDFNNLTQEPTDRANNILDEGRKALADKKVIAYLVTNDNPAAIATAKYLWGGAQQVGLTVGGVLFNQGQNTEAITAEFNPLSIAAIPNRTGDDWQPLIEALPEFQQTVEAPQPVTVDLAARQIKVFLPGFDKKQVKLTQYGPEITIEAGDQRRNIELPSSLRGHPVKGAKFQSGYLIISF